MKALVTFKTNNTKTGFTQPKRDPFLIQILMNSLEVKRQGSMKVIIAYSTKQMKMYFIEQKQSYFRQKQRRPDMNQANEDLHNKCIIKLK